MQSPIWWSHLTISLDNYTVLNGKRNFYKPFFIRVVQRNLLEVKLFFWSLVRSYFNLCRCRSEVEHYKTWFQPNGYQNWPSFVAPENYFRELFSDFLFTVAKSYLFSANYFGKREMWYKYITTIAFQPTKHAWLYTCLQDYRETNHFAANEWQRDEGCWDSHLKWRMIF